METASKQHFLSGKKIVVVGAGIGGLTFCIALQQFLEKNDHQIQPLPSVVLYERESSANMNGREGYSLSIRGDSLSGGLQILQKLDILDAISAESNPGGHFTLFNSDLSSLIEFRSPPVEGFAYPCIRVPRTTLRTLLNGHLSSSIQVNWNCGVIGAEELDNGKVLLNSMDGRQEQCDILVVADGSNSKVRQALRPQHELRFAGAICISGRTHALDALPPPLDTSFGGVLSGNGNFLFLAANDRTSALWSVSYLSGTPCKHKPAGALSEAEIDEVLAEAELRLRPYGEPIPTIFKQTLRSSVSVFNAQDLMPFRNYGSVIFIGDAQHAMSPFAGNGANMAMMDGYELAMLLVLSNSLPSPVQAYDNLAIPRSTTSISMSHRTIAMGHSQGIWKHMWVAALKVIAWYFNFNIVPTTKKSR